MRLSRWIQGSYETDAEMAAEAAALAGLAEVLPPRSDAEILVVNSSLRVGREVLDRAPSARLVVTTTSGYDHLDLPLLSQRGVAACRLPLARRDAVVEAALGLLLTGLRCEGRLRAAAEAGRWARGELPSLPVRTLRGARVGVVGLGVIGSRMAEVLAALGAEVWGCDPAGLPAGVRAASVDEMLRECDAITLHCHLAAGSRRLLSRERLRGARPGLVLVNTARGDLMDVDAAVEALDAGVLGAVGVDVFPEEPWPRLAAAAGRPDLYFTPHSAGYHRGLAAAVRAELAAAVAAWASGRPLPWPVV